MIRLTVKIKDRTLENITLDKDEAMIGRDAGCDIHLDNPAISRNHAKIVKKDDGYRVEDLGSSNGTFVNDRPADKTLLASGDRITVGKFTIDVQIPTAESGEVKKNFAFDIEGTMQFDRDQVQSAIQQTGQHRAAVTAAHATAPTDSTTKGLLNFIGGLAIGLTAGFAMGWFLGNR